MTEREETTVGVGRERTLGSATVCTNRTATEMASYIDKARIRMSNVERALDAMGTETDGGILQDLSATKTLLTIIADQVDKISSFLRASKSHMCTVLLDMFVISETLLIL